MKRVIISAVAALLLSVPAAFSQSRVNIDKDGLLKKVEKSDADIANPKKMDNPATWLNRGKLFYAVETEVSKNLYEGLDKTLSELMFGKPSSQEVVVVNNSEYVKLTYPYFVAYTDGTGTYRAWEVTYQIMEGALDEAIVSYEKAYELDQVAKKPGKNTAKINQGMNEIFNHLYKDGSIYFTLGQYGNAGDAFERAVNITELDSYGPVDEQLVASLAHDAGVAYLFAPDYQKSVDYFTKAESMGYERDGEIYYLLYHAYKGLAETKPEVLQDAKVALEKGLGKYPDNANIIECMTDVYVALGEDPNSIVPIVETAISKDPENPALWNGLGRVYERLGDLDRSIAAFEHVAVLLPDNFNAHYSVGILYLREADALMQEVNSRSYSGQKEYDAELAKVFDVYKKAMVPLERAHELNPTEPVTVELLKNVSFRLRDQDGMMDKYNKYNELFKSMQE